MVRQSFDGLHASDSIKEEFIAKINHIENRQYFHRKRTAMRQGAHHGLANHAAVNQSAYSRLQPEDSRASVRSRDFSGPAAVRLPHNHRSRFNPNNTSASLAERSSARKVEKSVDFKLTSSDVVESKNEAAIPPADNSVDVKEVRVDI